MLNRLVYCAAHAAMHMTADVFWVLLGILAWNLTRQMSMMTSAQSETWMPCARYERCD